MIKNSIEDLKVLKEKYNVSYLLAILSNRGWHSLFFYRISNFLWKNKIPLLPLVLTRVIQVIYGIDIDFRCKIDSGVILIHGVGIVIGNGVEIKSGSIIYHQVTLGIKGSGINDGFPKIGKNVVLGAGSKLLGNIVIGDDCIIGPNVVLMDNVDKNTIVKVPKSVFRIKAR